MTGVCGFPSCDHPPTTTNRAGQRTCDLHQPVVVSTRGSWVDDAHTEGGHG